ncbi:CotO family spore coat protein [Bacillus salacetis]|uniref:CotO family spore coat protein n=1 Tax=Bacillus salacetis TaxID=2315464 RepID=UPI003BA08BC6
MSKSPKSSRKTPLLYIQQPSLKETKANMQQSYSSRNAKPKPVEKPSTESVAEKKPKRRKRSYFEEELGSLYGEENVKESVTQETEEDQQNEDVEELEEREPENKKRSFSFKPLKPFREMELDEKINYLSRYINGKAPFPCEFVTEEDRYKGILIKGGDEVLVIKSFQGDEVEINRSSLRAIKIIGL